MSDELTWFKSSRSDGPQTDCVEVAFSPTKRHIRDSKSPTGPVLDFSRSQYRDFIDHVKKLDR